MFVVVAATTALLAVGHSDHSNYCKQRRPQLLLRNYASAFAIVSTISNLWSSITTAATLAPTTIINAGKADYGALE